MTLTHFSLFSGIGGIDLAAEWAGFETVGQCEFADYPTKVLEKHWPEVPRWRDVRDVTREKVMERGISGITLLSGGFPCQPFSVAGKQKGKGDDRYLWPEMLRIIGELAPRWVIGENVPGILSIAADDVCKDLERQGYEVGIFDYEAAAVGAKHRRERIFFVANAKSIAGLKRFEFNMQWGWKDETKQVGVGGRGNVENVADTQSEFTRRLPIGEGTKKPGFVGGGSDVSNTNNERLQIARQQPRFKEVSAKNRTEFRNWWSTEPNVGRVANGIPSRVDRLKCLGNAVVPQQVYPILKAIADIENGVMG
jgi:DNA (cytosine-5)-methyltransferase 1